MPLKSIVSADLPVQLKTASYTLLASDVGTEVQFESAVAVTANLPAVGEAGNGYNVILRNVGTGVLTVDPSGSEQIDGQSSLSVSTGGWNWIRSDGTTWKTISGGIGVVAGSGRLVQFVSDTDSNLASGTGTIPADNSIPQNTEGDQYMSIDVTPEYASSELLIEFSGVFASSINGGQVVNALFKNSDVSALAATAVTCDNNAAPYTFALRHVEPSSNTMLRTYKIRAGGHVSSTTTFNGTNSSTGLYGGVCASVLTVKEIL